MKKNKIFLTVYSALVISLLWTVPVAAQIPSPAGWSLLPIVDSADDV
ncbi:MAG: hypothetical protein ACTSQ8_10100 [Candidatus Helarchaeota archaeon]